MLEWFKLGMMERVTGLQALDQLSTSNDNRLRRFGAILLLILLGYWTYQLLRAYPTGQAPWIFIDYLNLAIHEAGHWLWLPFGQFWSAAGGSLTQVLLPLAIVVVFIRQRDLLGAGFGLFWVGNNLVNVSYYIADAQSQILPLLGGDGVTHDWNWLLSKIRLLENASNIALTVQLVGAGLLLLAIASVVLAILTIRTNRVYV